MKHKDHIKKLSYIDYRDQIEKRKKKGSCTGTKNILVFIHILDIQFFHYVITPKGSVMTATDRRDNIKNVCYV